MEEKRHIVCENTLNFGTYAYVFETFTEIMAEKRKLSTWWRKWPETNYFSQYGAVFKNKNWQISL